MRQEKIGFGNATMSRRTFFAAAGATTLAAAVPLRADSTTMGDGTGMQTETLTGNGEWTYRIITGWGKLPHGTVFGGTHGAIAEDNAGHIYVSTQSETGVLVYGGGGELLKTIAGGFPEIHSMVHAEEGGTEYLYCTVQKGTPTENWLF